MDELRIGDRVIAVVRGDITTIPADAIVNAANERLVGVAEPDAGDGRVRGGRLAIGRSAELEVHEGMLRRRGVAGRSGGSGCIGDPPTTRTRSEPGGKTCSSLG